MDSKIHNLDLSILNDELEYYKIKGLTSVCVKNLLVEFTKEYLTSFNTINGKKYHDIFYRHLETIGVPKTTLNLIFKEEKIEIQGFYFFTES